MSPLSLEKNLRTCKVNTGWANRNQSDRFQDPSSMVCPTWNNMDMAGRLVCANSFYTKRAGCNSPLDRVVVENGVSRPQYMQYVQLNASGIRGENGYPGPTLAAPGNNNTAASVNAQVGTDEQYMAYQQAGNWTNQFTSTVSGGCPSNAYQQGMAQIARSNAQ